MIGRKIVKYITIIILKIKYGKHIQCPWSVYIDPSIRIRFNGQGKVIFGDNVEIRSNVVINVSDGGIVTVDNNSFINDYCCINARDHISIGENCQIGQGVKIYDHDHDYSIEDSRHNFLVDQVIISNKTWIGSNVVILKGTRIGENCVIGAGTIIKCTVPAGTVCYTHTDLTMKSVSKSS